MLARLYTFTAGTTIQSSQVNAEFDQIVKLLSGQKIDTALLKSSSTSDPTLAVDNTGGGKVQEWRVGGTAKAQVNATGQFESLIATGTAPFVVASTTKVTNLNADKLDDKDIADILLSVDPSVKANGSGASQLVLENSSSHVRLQNAASVFEVWNTTAGTNLVSVNKATRAWAFPAGASFAAEVTGVTPATAAGLATKGYTDGLKVRWQLNAYHNDASNLSSDFGEKRAFVVPTGVSNFTVRRVRVFYTGGSLNSGPPALTVIWYNSANVNQGFLGGTSYIIPVGHPVIRPYTWELATPTVMQPGDYLYMSPNNGSNTTASGVTWMLEGDYTLG